MKLFLRLLFIILLFSCNDSNLIGEDQDDIIDDVEIIVTDRTSSSTELIALGNITNKGAETITPPWYLEGKFYADNTLSSVIGGDNVRQIISLAPEESMDWNLSISSSDLTNSSADISDYPFFTVGSLRAYK